MLNITPRSIITHSLNFILAIAITVIVSRYFRYAPPHGDGGAFAAVGNSLNHNQVLYKDVWDNKAPGIFFLNKWALQVSPVKDRAPFLLRTLFIFLFSAGTFFLFGKTIIKSLLVFPLLLLSWEFIADWKYFESGHFTEFFGASLLVCSLAMVKSRAFLYHYFTFLTGLIIGFSVLIKEPFLPVTFLIGLYGFIHSGKKNKIILISGIITPILVFLSYLIWYNAFRDYLIYLQFALNYSSGETGFTIPEFKLLWLNQPSYIKLFIVIIFLNILDYKRMGADTFISVLYWFLVLSSLVFLYIPNHIYGHYHIPFFMLFCILAINSVLWAIADLPASVLDLLGNGKIKAAFYIIIIFLFALAVYKPVSKAFSKFSFQLYQLKFNPEHEKKAFKSKIQMNDKLFVEHEFYGRFYLYHEVFYPVKFVTPYYGYFGVTNPNMREKANRSLLTGQLQSTPPDIILGRKKPGVAFWKCGLLEWTDANYSIYDSLITCEGDTLYIRRKNNQKLTE